jgi:hypothetical protein
MIASLIIYIASCLLVFVGMIYLRKRGVDYALLGHRLNRGLDALIARMDK